MVKLVHVPKSDSASRPGRVREHNSTKQNLVQRVPVGTLQSRTEICLSIIVFYFYFLILHCSYPYHINVCLYRSGIRNERDTTQ